MTYREGSYWEKRYREGGRSGQGLSAEWNFLVERVAAAVEEYQVRSILDVGVGDGRLAVALVSALADETDYAGVDISPSGIKAARQVLPGAALRVADLVDGPLPSWDAVLCFNVHYHVATDGRAEHLVKNLLASATKVVLVLTWNAKVLERGKLAAHCHYRPFRVPPGSAFELADERTIPSSPHKTLYTLVRARDPR